MELDPRIKSLSDILTPFDVGKAKEFVGQKGFFANSIDCFRAGEPYCKYGTLLNVFDTPDQTDPFQRRDDGDLYSFFLPENRLKPTEKKYRPYTLGEFSGKFAIGAPVVFRSKGEPTVVWTAILTGYRQQEESGATVFMGAYPYKLDELFKLYERYEDETGSWDPFGVEVEE